MIPDRYDYVLLLFLAYEEMTCGLALPAYTRFDWLALVLADLHTRDLIGCRLRLSFKSRTLLYFCSEHRYALLPECSSANRDVTPFKVNGQKR